MIIVGIDIAKHNHQAIIIDERGAALCKSFSFANSNAGAKKLTDAIAQITADPAEVIVGMEATGHYWLALYSALLPLGFTLHVINPIQTDAMRHATTIRKSKTDVIDCELIAQTIRFG
jgi:transposase